MHLALDLITLRHEPWEIELVIDELDTYLGLIDLPPRSHNPVGVRPEL